MITKFAKVLCQIADILPRANLTLVLYPTAMMQDVLSRLYANIIQVMSQAIHWYKQGKLKHSVSSVFRPWALSFEENVELIREGSIRLDKLADIAAKAELRDTHVEVIEMRLENRKLAAFITSRMGQIESAIICRSFPYKFKRRTLRSLRL